MLDAEGKSSSERNDYDQAILSQSGEHDTGHINGVNRHISLNVTEPLGRKHKHFNGKNYP